MGTPIIYVGIGQAIYNVVKCLYSYNHNYSIFFIKNNQAKDQERERDRFISIIK